MNILFITYHPFTPHSTIVIFTLISWPSIVTPHSSPIIYIILTPLTHNWPPEHFLSIAIACSLYHMSSITWVVDYALVALDCKSVYLLTTPLPYPQLHLHFLPSLAVSYLPQPAPPAFAGTWIRCSRDEKVVHVVHSSGVCTSTTV